MQIFTVIYFLSLFGPVLLLLVGWWKHYSRKIPLPIPSFVVLLLTSISYAYLLLALVLKAVLLGPDYSDRLFLTVQTGAALNFLLSIATIFIETSILLLLIATSFTVGLAWFLVWAINTAV